MNHKHLFWNNLVLTVLYFKKIIFHRTNWKQCSKSPGSEFNKKVCCGNQQCWTIVRRPRIPKPSIQVLLRFQFLKNRKTSSKETVEWRCKLFRFFLLKINLKSWFLHESNLRIYAPETNTDINRIYTVLRRKKTTLKFGLVF